MLFLIPTEQLSNIVDIDEKNHLITVKGVINKIKIKENYFILQIKDTSGLLNVRLNKDQVEVSDLKEGTFCKFSGKLSTYFYEKTLLVTRKRDFQCF